MECQTRPHSAALHAILDLIKPNHHDVVAKIYMQSFNLNGKSVEICGVSGYTLTPALHDHGGHQAQEVRTAAS